LYYFTLNEDESELDFQHIPFNNNNNVISKANAERTILTNPYKYPPFDDNYIIPHNKNTSCKEHTYRFD